MITEESKDYFESEEPTAKGRQIGKEFSRKEFDQLNVLKDEENGRTSREQEKSIDKRLDEYDLQTEENVSGNEGNHVGPYEPPPELRPKGSIQIPCSEDDGFIDFGRSLYGGVEQICYQQG